MVYEMELHKYSFKNTAVGKRTIDVRPYDSKYNALKIDDIIIFINSANANEKLPSRVTALYRYRTFEELFFEITPQRCGFVDKITPKEAATFTKQIYPDRKTGQNKDVLGIRFDLISFDEVDEEQKKKKQNQGQGL